MEDDYAFTWWHVLTGYMVVLAPIWFYYAYVMCVFPKEVKPRSVCRRVKKQQESVPPLSVLARRALERNQEIK